jgi:hypothetical protein
MQIDTLRAIGDEGAGFGGGARRHDHKEGVLMHGQEGLAAFGVAFDQVECVGKLAGFGVEDRDAGFAIVAGVDAGAVVVAFAQACVDQPKITCCVKNIAGSYWVFWLRQTGGFTPPDPRGILSDR